MEAAQRPTALKQGTDHLDADLRQQPKAANELPGEGKAAPAPPCCSKGQQCSCSPCSKQGALQPLPSCHPSPTGGLYAAEGEYKRGCSKQNEIVWKTEQKAILILPHLWLFQSCFPKKHPVGITGCRASTDLRL